MVAVVRMAPGKRTGGVIDNLESGVRRRRLGEIAPAGLDSPSGRLRSRAPRWDRPAKLMPATATEPRTSEIRCHSMLIRIAAGDETALAELYDATAPIVHGVTSRLLRDPGAAEEVTVRTYHDVWRSAASYDASRGTPLAWLRTMARSRALDVLRSKSREQQVLSRLARDAAAELRDREPDPEESSIEHERAELLRSALAGLSESERRPIELAYYQGFSHSEIATVLEEPLGTVKSRIRLGMNKLRAELARAGLEA